MQLELAFVLLFAVATAVALIARWLEIPYTVALVLAGLALGSAQAFGVCGIFTSSGRSLPRNPTPRGATSSSPRRMP
jgi:Kef-type K+ transport system membrane component KefB